MTDQTASQPEAVAGLLAEFDGPQALVAAAARVRQEGYRRWDAHSPFPVHGLERAMGMRPSLLPWLVLAAGIAGAVAAMLLQWWTNAVDYPFLVSGKPYFSLPANIPVAFELIVLFSALAAFGGALALNRLPQFSHPLFRSDCFQRASTDGFFISVDAGDPNFDESRTRELLESLGAAAVEVYREPVGGRVIPGRLYWGLAVLLAMSLLPPLGIAWYRSVPKRQPRIHPIQDMDFQPKFKAQAANPFFEDGRAMRLPIARTVALGQLEEDDALARGKVPGTADQWIATFPLPVDMELVERGRERFKIFCAPCHGLVGEGDGMVSGRAMKRDEEKWVPPLSLHVDSVREQPVGQIFHSITGGVRTMPAYGSQIPVEDRWAIVLYVRALQRSQHASPEDVPPEMKDQVR